MNQIDIQRLHNLANLSVSRACPDGLSAQSRNEMSALVIEAVALLIHQSQRIKELKSQLQKPKSPSNTPDWLSSIFGVKK